MLESNTTDIFIYRDSIAPGWTVNGRGGAKIQEEVAGAVNFDSSAFCATLPAADVSGPMFC